MADSGLTSDQLNALISAFGGGGSTAGQVSAGLGGAQLPAPPQYSPVNVPQLSGGGQLDQELINLLSGQSVLPSNGIVGGLESILPQISGNQYAPGLISAAQQAGGLSGQQGQQDIQGADQLFNASTAGLPDLQSLLVSAFDPQNALHDSLSKQLTDNINASLAGSGLLNSPVGAGVLGNDLGNFNINWQNNLLNRMTSGLSAYGTGLNNIGSGLTTAGNLGNTGVSAVANAGALPYGAANTATSNTLSQLLSLLSGQTGQLGAVAGPLQSYQGGVTSRLGQGVSASGANYQNQTAQYLQALKSIAGLFSGGNPATGGGGVTSAGGGLNYGAPAYSQPQQPTASWPQPSYIPAGSPDVYGQPDQPVGNNLPPSSFDTGMSSVIPPIDYGAGGGFGPGSNVYDINQSAWSGYTGDSGSY